MTKREFKRRLNELSTERDGVSLLDVEKIATSDPEMLTELVHHIVKNRWALIREMVERSNVDREWLHSCGYFHTGKNEYFNFICTEEIKIHQSL